MNGQDSLNFEGRGQIRCVQQLGMVRLWERLKGAAELPDIAAVNGPDLERLRDKLMLLDVVWDNGEPRYLIRFHGVNFEKVNQRNCVGRFLDETIPAPVRESGLRTYRDVLDRRLPVFNATMVRESAGEAVSYERLLLPFTATGQGVERIFTVVTLFAEDNSSPFEIMRAAGQLSA